MKTFVIIALLALSLAARADLVITEVMSSSGNANTAANGDWWELYNSGPLAIDLTQYSWDDNSAVAGSAHFGGLTIGSGQAIIVCQEGVGGEQAWKDAWGVTGVTVINIGNTEFQNLGSGGDEVHVYDPSGVQLAAVSFGTTVTGYSFAWDSTGNALGQSVLGENGAFQATTLAGASPDTGSPGYVTVVPEPGIYVLLCVGALALLWRCRTDR